MKECRELFFGFFFGPLFLYGFGGFLFGFFSCVLAFAHGCAPCVVKWYRLLCCSVENGTDPIRKSIDGVGFCDFKGRANGEKQF